MRGILFCTICAAFTLLDATATFQSKGLLVENIDPEVVGGASHHCYRQCNTNDTRICYYEFALDEWLTMNNWCDDCPYTVEDCYNRGCMTASGAQRTASVVNHMLPGPSIQVCRGDTIQVNLTNAGSTKGITIHWHGMSMTESPYMDGVPFVTQCPILPGNTFLYNFTADPPGTHMWHSHFGLQETDGFHGSLIIREPDDVNANYYDYDLAEHVMVIWHWFNTSTEAVMTRLTYGGGSLTGYSITVNGYAATMKYTKNNTDYYTPRANFTVTKGYRYRFRVIGNFGIYCPVQVSVDNHTLTMIASDGATFEPTEVDSFIINAGERYDFVLTADQEVRNYWIRYRSFGYCSTMSEVAILYYEGANTDDPSGTTDYEDANRSGTLLNPVGEADIDYPNNTLIRVVDLNNTMASNEAKNISGTPSVTLYVSLGLNYYENSQVKGGYTQFNNISFKFPPIPPLTQYNDITADMYCTQYNDNSESCYGDYCTCPYIYEIGKNILVEIILVDETAGGTDDHPIHLHGHYYRVVAVKTGNASNITVSEVRALNEAGLIDKNLDTAPLKDTIGVPARGFVVLRLVTNNPGYWLFHCHVGAHFELGMGAVLKVGEHSEMVQPPPDFPTCSKNYDITKTPRY